MFYTFLINPCLNFYMVLLLVVILKFSSSIKKNSLFYVRYANCKASFGGLDWIFANIDSF